MSIAGQLYQLQELDAALSADEQRAVLIIRQLADKSAVNEMAANLTAARQKLETLAKELRALEWEIDDLSAKMKKVEKELYGGRVGNPKELTDLQHEDEMLKAKRSQLEDKDLSLMEQTESAAKAASTLEDELKKAEAEWQTRHQQLTAELEKLKSTIAALKQKRETQTTGIDAQAIATYEAIRKQRGAAVAQVEQGMCTGCRITLPAAEFQRARTGALVRCGSCGRILYVA